MSTLPKRRVVVTGLGAVTNIGTDVPTFWNNLVNGRSGVVPIESFPVDDEWATRCLLYTSPSPRDPE